LFAGILDPANLLSMHATLTSGIEI